MPRPLHPPDGWTFGVHGWAGVPGPGEEWVAWYDLWATEDSVAAHLEVRAGADEEAARPRLLRGCCDVLADRRPEPGVRPYALDEPAALVRLVLQEANDHVGCGYGPLGKGGALVRFSLRDLTYLAALDLGGR